MPWNGRTMLSIGDLAHHTRVSVRMLRHYDALSLVVPERVDQVTGHRWYAVSQIGRVNSLVALKELGFTLEQCGDILDEQLSVEQFRGMLRLRQAQLEQQIEADSGRLAEVGRRLRSIERGLTMTNSTLELKPLPRLRLAQTGGEVNDTTEIGTMTGILFAQLTERLTAGGLPADGQGIRTYYGRPDGGKIDVAVAVALDSDIQAIDGLELVDLPGVDRGASAIHRGPASEIGDAWQTLDVALDQRGLESYGVHRQIQLDTADPDNVVIELQCPVREAGTGCS